MDFLKENWMREIEEAVDIDKIEGTGDETSPPVNFGSNAAADAKEEQQQQQQQGEQDILVSTPEQPHVSPVSLSPDTPNCNNNTWPESFFQFTTDCLTNPAYDFAADMHSFDSQAYSLPEMDSFFKVEDLQTQQAISCLDQWP